MGGGYIECGDYLGDDKSGSPSEDILSLLFRRAAGRAAYSRRHLLGRFFRRGPRLPDWLDEFESALREPPVPHEIRLSAGVAGGLLPYAEKYHAELGEKLGNPAPSEAPELDSRAGMDPSAAKWGKGDGWRFYCTNDLVQALRQSLVTNLPVVITFD